MRRWPRSGKEFDAGRAGETGPQLRSTPPGAKPATRRSPHRGCARGRRPRQRDLKIPNIVLSTAHAAKFPMRSRPAGAATIAGFWLEGLMTKSEHIKV
jgi:threonine synthase